MRAVIAPDPGGPEALRVTTLPDPVAGTGEVVIDVVAAGVNRADLLQREGRYPPPAGASSVLGMEVSGRIAEVGPEVDGLVVGDEVCALLAGGGYAERVSVPAGQVLPRPGGVDLVSAAALPEATCTVWSNLVTVAGLHAGEWLLVHGGSSGIGTTAIQIASALGAHVAVTVGTEAKAARCLDLGADAAINYKGSDFVEDVDRITGGRGVDVVLDIVGADYLSRNIEVLATGGRLVIIGLQSGARAAIDLGVLLAKRASILSTTLRSRPLDQKAEIVASVRRSVWPMVADRRVVPVVDRVLPLDQAAEAHRLLAESGHVGKVLLTV
jgi:putative PIG3 family NAD(P)H quinone oxidoreductase